MTYLQQQRYLGEVIDLRAAVKRLSETIRLMAEATAKTAQEQDAEILRLIHENEQLRIALKAARETAAAAAESEVGE